MDSADELNDLNNQLLAQAMKMRHPTATSKHLDLVQELLEPREAIAPTVIRHVDVMALGLIASDIATDILTLSNYWMFDETLQLWNRVDAV
jgi:hypothetical protein